MTRMSKYLKVLFVLLFILFEEIVWNRIGEPAYNLVRSLKIMDKFRNWVSQVKNRYLVLIIFIKPFIIMEAMSIVAISYLASGSIMLGLFFYLIKILMTIPVVIIFNSCKEQLISFFIIKYCYGMILRFKRSTTFKMVKVYTTAIREQVGIFRDEYLKGDGSFKEELTKIYKNIKSI
mgnify:CR=1 FL=1